jgi:hypothetical protein
MKNLLKLAGIIFVGTAVAVLTGCTTAPKTWGNGKSMTVSYDEQDAYSYSEGLSEFDENNLVEGVINGLQKCKGMRMNSVYMVSDFTNNTSENMDVARIQRALIDKLNNHGYTGLIDKSSRPEIFNEMQYQSTGYTNQAQAAAKGRQAGVEYLIRLSISSQSQNNNDVKTVRYRMSLQTVNLESSLVTCTPAVELKKAYERTRVAL